jgi:hypothetical protein
MVLIRSYIPLLDLIFIADLCVNAVHDYLVNACSRMTKVFSQPLKILDFLEGKRNLL